MEVLNVPKNTIVLTGANGWVGRNFLNELQKIIPREEFNQKVKAFGSKKSEIFSSHYKSNLKIKSIFSLSFIISSIDFNGKIGIFIFKLDL